MTTTAHPLADRSARTRFNKALRQKGVPARACSRCLAVKALGQFPPDKRKPDGRDSRCLACNTARKADYRAANQEKGSATNRRYRDQYRDRWTAPDGSILEGDLSAPLRCTAVTNGGCGRMLTRGDFHAKRDTPSGRAPHCRDCKARRDAERAQRDRLAVLDALLAEGADRCHLCQGPFLPGDSWHIEHIHPRADEGAPDDLANLALAHDSCNLAKGSRDPFEVLPETLAEVGVDFHAAVRALQTYGQVVADLDEAA